ncbi:GNAT family N-acetyltransferase [Rheinheimera oceanensis]|uniref:GNAT family N-acetyltransferase n=1 Tax=Rheinheimera oceanensis TaxID=2817449 RepID=UPI001BFCDF0B|nr:GNAT family N-acetyltransferase [Rheinheimera oceanensis]
MTTQLVLASVSEMLQLQHWFSSAEQQQSWGGDNFDYLCTGLRFLQLLCRPGAQSFSLLDSDNNTMLGFGQICDRFGCHHLARLVIHPQQRGKGLAKALISELSIQALSQQYRDISLYVHRHNSIALQCYTSLGFEICPPPEAENPRLHFMMLQADKAIVSVNRYLQQQS